MARVGGTEVEVAAAWLHDVVEDTAVTLDEIERLFGAEVASVVEGLTDHPEFEPLPSSERKPLQAERLSEKSPSVRLVKLADATVNVRSVLFAPPVDMSPSECLDYVEGSLQIADRCRAESAVLGSLFDDVYAAAVQRYSAPEGFRM